MANGKNSERGGQGSYVITALLSCIATVLIMRGGTVFDSCDIKSIRPAHTSAAQSVSQTETPEQEDIPKETTEDASNSSTTSATAATERTTIGTTVTTVPQADFDRTAFELAMEGIIDYQKGSAGTSLKCAAAGMALLEFTEDDTLTEKQAQAVVRDYWDSLTPTEQATMKYNFDDIDYFCRELINDGAAMHIDRLDSAGVSPRHDSYTLANYERYADAIKECF